VPYPEFAAFLTRFDVVLSYDLGNGIRVEKGAELFQAASVSGESEGLKAPRPASKR
jgi:hypothetical protein